MHRIDLEHLLVGLQRLLVLVEVGERARAQILRVDGTRIQLDGLIAVVECGLPVLALHVIAAEDDELELARVLAERTDHLRRGLILGLQCELRHLERRVLGAEERRLHGAARFIDFTAQRELGVDVLHQLTPLHARHVFGVELVLVELLLDFFVIRRGVRGELVDLLLESIGDLLTDFRLGTGRGDERRHQHAHPATYRLLSRLLCRRRGGDQQSSACQCDPRELLLEQAWHLWSLHPEGTLWAALRKAAIPDLYTHEQRIVRRDTRLRTRPASCASCPCAVLLEDRKPSDSYLQAASPAPRRFAPPALAIPASVHPRGAVRAWAGVPLEGYTACTGGVGPAAEEARHDAGAGKQQLSRARGAHAR